MQKIQKCIAVILCLCYALAAFFPVALAVYASWHTCDEGQYEQGEQCPPCLQIAYIHSNTKRVPGHMPEKTTHAAYAPTTIFTVCADIAAGLYTPISLKIKMNN